MKKLTTALALAALLPLAGCATPYGYSSGAWANYDGGFDSGYQGYGGGGSYYGYGEPGYYQMNDAQYYGGQPYYGGGYYEQPYYGAPYQGTYYQRSPYGPYYGGRGY